MNLLYWRQLPPKEWETLKTLYKNHVEINRGGLTSKKFRKRLLGLTKENVAAGIKSKNKENEGGESKDSQFWYLIKESVRYALNDLRLVSETANHKQMKEMFQVTPYVLTEEFRKSSKQRKDITKEEQKYLKDQNLYTSFDVLLNSILNTPTPKDEDDLWKSLLVNEIMKVCLAHLKKTGVLMTKSHLRLIDEIEDLVDAIVGISVQISHEDRRRIKL